MSQVQKKKIIYLIGRLFVGGAERQVIETAIRLNRTFFDPKLYCLSEGGPLKELVERHNIDLTIFNTGRPDSSTSKSVLFRRTKKFLSLYQYLKKEQPDIVHCYVYAPSIYGGIAAKMAGNSILITNRRCLGLFKNAKPHYQFLENLVNRFTDRILVNSQAVKHAVLQREKVDPKKIHVIHNGVDIHTYKPLNARPELPSYLLKKKHKLGIPVTASVIGMIANLIPYKGYEDFLLAVSEVHQDYPNVRFLCIGEDRGIKSQLEHLIQKLGLQRYVIFTGRVDNMAEMLHLIDIQVSASHQEGFSNSILEGMASGKPVIATSVGGTPEAVLDNVTGLLIPPQDPKSLAHAIISLLANPELASLFGQNGRKRIERHFSVEMMIDRLESLYLELLNHNKR